MSLKTWKAEFYPKPASRVSKKDALAHSLRKWEGLKRANLKKHSLKRAAFGWRVLGDENDNRIEIDADTCALCTHYIKGSFENCVECPLYAVRAENCYGTDGSPYSEFTDNGDARPMIRLIKKAMKAEK